MHDKTQKSFLRAVGPCLVVLLLAYGGSLLVFPVLAADAETRSLKIYYVHTNERADIVFKKNGRYVKSGLKRLNYLLRDWRRNEPTKLDPRLFDLVWQVYRLSGSRDYIHVISAYRSPQTNTMLRLRSQNSGVARNSQHTLGRALDFYLPDVSLKRLRELGLKQQTGGVGYYPGSGSPFVHMDVGNVRHWPRMSRGELMALFPDGKTMHIPSDGQPLPHYAQAVAEYKARGGQPPQMVAGAAKSGNSFASLAVKAHHDAGSSQPSALARAEPGAELQVAALPAVVVPVPPASPLRVDTAAATPQEAGAVLSYAQTAPALGAVPVPGRKPVEPGYEQNNPVDAGQMVASITPDQIPLPAQRASARVDMHDEPAEDEIAVAIRQNSAITLSAADHASAPHDEIGALIAQQDIISVPQDDEEEENGEDGTQDEVAPPAPEPQTKEHPAAGQAALPTPQAVHTEPGMTDIVTTPKTSKQEIVQAAENPAHADSPDQQTGSAVSAAEELKQLPDMVFTYGLQKLDARPQSRRLSGSAVNFRSVARVTGFY